MLGYRGRGVHKIFHHKDKAGNALYHLQLQGLHTQLCYNEFLQGLAHGRRRK